MSASCAPQRSRQTDSVSLRALSRVGRTLPGSGTGSLTVTSGIWSQASGAGVGSGVAVGTGVATAARRASLTDCRAPRVGAGAGVTGPRVGVGPGAAAAQRLDRPDAPDVEGTGQRDDGEDRGEADREHAARARWREAPATERLLDEPPAHGRHEHAREREREPRSRDPAAPRGPRRAGSGSASARGTASS